MKSALKKTVGFESMIRERRRVVGITLMELAKNADRNEGEVWCVTFGKAELLLARALHVCDVCEIIMDELKAFVSQNITANV